MVQKGEAFVLTIQHSVRQAAVERGAVELWRLFSAKVENERNRFKQALSGASPDGRRVPPPGPFDRSRVRHWLERMEVELAPIANWLP